MMKMFGVPWRNGLHNNMKHLPNHHTDPYAYNYWYTYPNVAPTPFQPHGKGKKERQRVDRKRNIPRDLPVTYRYRPPKLSLRQMVRYCCSTKKCVYLIFLICMIDQSPHPFMNDLFKNDLAHAKLFFLSEMPINEQF